MNITFETLRQAAAALGLAEEILVAAREIGCVAFIHGRVRANLLVEFLASEVQAVNRTVAIDWLYNSTPPRLTGPIVERVRRRLAELAAQAAPEKRHRGREIAAAVRRELTDTTARQIAGMDPEAAVATLAQLRERILAA
ncbi:MAG: hypothetical protein IPL39_15065 [Opitutaceae bacterium]|nr:hypothetical protein [Opitutaceae bacterium]